jgi:hypothetical protein
LRRLYQQWATVFQLLLMGSGVAVFSVGAATNVQFVPLFLGNKVSCALIGLTFMSMVISLKLIFSPFQWWLRGVVGLQVTFILAAFISAIYPNIILRDNGNSVSLLSAAAPSSTMVSLAVVLSLGLLSVFPVLIYLMKVFKLSSVD